MENKIIEIAAIIFKVDKTEISINTTREEVGTWTSFAHIALIGRLEESLGLIVPIEEVPKIKKLSDFLNYMGEN